MTRRSKSTIRIRTISTLLITLAAMAVTAANRPSALAGAWYPGDPATLSELVDGMLDAADGEPVEGRVRALVLPHAGYQYSGPTAAAGVDQVRGGDYRRVVVLAPTHHVGFDGLSIADVDAYETPLGAIPLDKEAIERLRRSPLVQSIPDAHASEHSIEIELPLLQRALKPGWHLVPILVGDLAPEDYPRAADLLRPLADDRTLIVASSDLTHYGPRFGYLPFPADDALPGKIKGLDDGAIEKILARDGPGLLDYQSRTGITMCGYRPVALLLDLLPPDASVHRVAYATSGEITGDWSSSVSYAALAVTAPHPLSTTSTASQDPTAGDAPSAGALQRLHDLAALAVRRATLGKDGVPDEEVNASLAHIPSDLKRPAGAFVTLWKHGQLRGCVGHVPNDVTVAEAVLESGVNAARNDYRFRPVRADELDSLDVEVNVLTPPHPIDSIDEFIPGRHGITLRKDGHYALYLPEVATEMGWDRETTLSNLAEKAGLPADAWRDGASFEIFTSRHYRAPLGTTSDQPSPEANAH